jgi:hypothetical protein
MDVDEEIQNLKKGEIKLRDDYLNRLIDFLKWTTTIALAAGLWIGTNLPSHLPMSDDIWKKIQLLFLIGSFGCIIISILMAIILIYLILGLWEKEFSYFGQITPIIEIFNKNREESFTDSEFIRQIKDIKTFHLDLSIIEKINFYFKIHVILLLLGIMSFYFAIILQ